MSSPIGSIQKWVLSDTSWPQWGRPQWRLTWPFTRRALKGSSRRNRYFFSIVCIWVLALHLTHLMAKSDHGPIVWGPPVEPPGSVIVTNGQTELTSAALQGQDRADDEKSELADGEVPPHGLRATLRQWSEAWQRQDVPAYLDMYTPEFVPSTGFSRDAWVQSRTQRIREKRSIRHEMRDLDIQMSTSTAVVKFTQIYQDEKVKLIDQKTMHWVYRDGLWMISLEKTN